MWPIISRVINWDQRRRFSISLIIHLYSLNIRNGINYIEMNTREEREMHLTVVSSENWR